MPARLLLVAAVVAACGPRAAPAPAAAPRAAALVVAAPDVATLDAAAAVLAPIAGDRLASIRIGVAAPWTTPELAARGIAIDAPLGAALTADGVAIRWAGVAAIDELAAAFDATPGAARWSSGDARLWRLGDDAIAVIAGRRAAVISAGAASTRERVALEVAAGALRVAPAATAGTLAFEVEAELVIGLFTTAEPGPLLDALGADLGRLRGTIVAAADRVTVEVDVRPRPGSLADRLIGGARGVGAPIARGAFALSSRLAPAEAAEVLVALGKRETIDAGYLISRTGKGVEALTGELSIGPGGVGLRVVDAATARAAQDGTKAALQAPNGLVFGASGGITSGAGLNLAPDAVAVFPIERPAPGTIDGLLDENIDVPWSQPYRAARAAHDAAQDALAKARTAVDGAWSSARYQWSLRWGPPLVVPFARTGPGYHGRGAWRPPVGTIATTAAAAAKELEPLDAARTAYSAARDAEARARDHALRIRARDVAEWDRRVR